MNLMAVPLPRSHSFCGGIRAWAACQPVWTCLDAQFIDKTRWDQLWLYLLTKKKGTLLTIVRLSNRYVILRTNLFIWRTLENFFLPLGRRRHLRVVALESQMKDEHGTPIQTKAPRMSLRHAWNAMRKPTAVSRSWCRLKLTWDGTESQGTYTSI